MKVVALISGGKDSCFNIMQCIAEGHEVVALANLYPSDELESEELDSYMFQSVGYKGVDFYAKAMNLPLYRRVILGKSLYLEKNYCPTLSDEVEDLYSLLCQVKSHHPELEAVSSGAILSDYQRNRVENVCDRLNLISVAYLWQRNQINLLSEMVESGLDAIIIKVASFGLTKRHLQEHLRDLQPQLLNLAEKFELNVCGEGGEYETFTLDTPLFTHTIVIETSSIVESSDEATLSPVAYLAINKLRLVEKDVSVVKRTKAELCTLPMLTKQKSLIDLYSKVKCEIQETVPISIFPDETDHSPVKFTFKAVGPIVAQIDWSLGENSIYESALNSLLVLKEKIEEVSGFQHVVYSLVCVRDMSWFVDINRAYSQIFPKFHPPPRACIAVPEYTVHKETVFVPDVSFSCLLSTTKSVTTNHLHVKSLSHWAPANIGPYSQAVQLNSLSSTRLFVSGQIGMLPEDLSLANTVREQACLSLRHVERIAKAACNFNLINNFDFGICYATNRANLEVCRTIFHDMICELSNFAGQCTCNRLIWVCVNALPKSAAVEWQMVLKNQAVPSALLLSSRNDRPPLYVVTINSSVTNNCCDCLLIPVNCFLDDQINCYVYL